MLRGSGAVSGGQRQAPVLYRRDISAVLVPARPFLECWRVCVPEELKTLANK